MPKVQLTKKEFLQHFNAIREGIKKREEFGKAIDKICDGYPVVMLGNEWLDTSLTLLSKLMNDEPDQHGTMLEWWLWGIGDGEKFIYIDHENGVDKIKISVNTPEELYDYLANRENDNDE